MSDQRICDPSQHHGNGALAIEQANVEDAQEILDLQKLAYQSEAAIYNDYTIPPLTQTLEGIETDFEKQVFLKATIEGRIIGSVRGILNGGTCFIGRLIVHPDFQNRGIGARLLNKIEQTFSQAQRFELFTGDKSERNLYLYQKQGYKPFKTEMITEDLGIVFLEKHKGLQVSPPLRARHLGVVMRENSVQLKLGRTTIWISLNENFTKQL
jgi:GNAT superfamily N-acetyltransferase